ncbi:hypothetical protein LCGC14_3066060 [marine sediment metagenome]|uniref:Uncharacterized protein n=1 Tax=marine sediment metagenome TaxID=412755 RepID=A0A0F8WHD5_9ZZZZ
MTISGRGFIFIEPEQAQQCDLCGKITELRPYGPNGACICYECGEKDPETTKQMFNQRVERVLAMKGESDG